jgi:catecholate siderophore receptor
MYAAIDNTVTLPGYTRTDAAIFYSVTEKLIMQVNVENAFNRRFFVNANSNNNISPGQPIGARLGVSWKF